MMPARRVVVPVLALALSLGCNRRDIEAESREEAKQNATKVTADSTVDATEPIVNEAFAFRLKQPGEGWKLLGGADIKKVNPDAVAGAMKGGKIFGMVIVERFPGADLGEISELLWAEHELLDQEDLDFAGFAAKRGRLSRQLDGHDFDFMSTVFVREDYLYQLVSWGADGTPESDLLRFHVALELLPGPVRGMDNAPVAVTEADGVGWRVREGVYESALSGLRVDPPEGWRIVVGSEYEQMDTDAELIMVRDRDNLYAALVSERVGASQREAMVGFVTEQFETTMGTKPVGSRELEVLGNTTAFTSYHGGPLEFLHGVFSAPEIVTQLYYWYPRLSGDKLAPLLPPLAASIERLDAGALASLRDDLLHTPPSQARFEGERAYRGGVFLDFAHQLRWTKPEGFWSVSSFEQARDNSPETVFFVSELDLGVYGALEVFPSEGSDAGQILDYLLEGQSVESRETVQRNGMTVQLGEGINRKSKPSVRSRYLITEREGTTIALSVWTAADGEPQRRAMADLVDGFEPHASLEEVSVENGLVTDLRYGLRFAEPEGLRRNTPNRVTFGRVHTWQSGKEEFVAAVGYIMGSDIDEESWTTSFVEQLVRDAVTNIDDFGKPTRTEGTLGPFESRRLTWTRGRDQLVVDIAIHNRMSYLSLASNLDEAELNRLRSSYTLL